MAPDTIGQQVRDVPTLEKCFGHDDEVLARVEPVSNARGGAVLEAVEAAGGSLETAAEGLIAPVRLLATPAWRGGHSW